MTTDITELAPAMKAAAELITSGYSRKWIASHDDETCWVGANDDDGNLNPFIEVSITDWSGNKADNETLARFIALCRPANVLALVEALEKAQAQSSKWLEAYHKAVSIGARYEERIAELESRTVTVKLPPELYTIGELIRTQDNRITDQPMFVVFQKREIIGSDEHSPSRICWVWDGEEVSELRAKRLEALYQDGRDTRRYDRYAMQEVDEFVTACFTEHGCKDFLRQNGHNLRLPYIYACGSFRNNEYQLVRNWLAGVNVESE